MIAEGMLGRPASHNHASDLVSSFWGSYFYHPEPQKRNGSILSRASSFAKRKPSIGDIGGGAVRGSCNATISEMKKVINIRRVSSFKESDTTGPRSRPPSVMGRARSVKSRGSSPISIRSSRGDDSPDCGNSSPLTLSTTPGDHGVMVRAGSSHSSGRDTPCDQEETVPPAKGPAKINTLWGNCIKNYAKMCIPDLDVLVNYPIDYKYPVFCKDSSGEITNSGFFPSDPISLHIPQSSMR